MLLTLVSCGDDDVRLEEIIVLEDLTDVIAADGTTRVSIKAILNEEADLTLRKIEFIASHGSFIGASDPANKIIVEAKKVDGEIFAEPLWRAPYSVAEVVFKAQPVLSDRLGEFQTEVILSLDSSIVETIELTVPSFSVYNDFQGEIAITGQLRNDKRSGVSDGVEVVIEDYFEDGTTRVNGRFRDSKLISKGSLISTVYSPGEVMAGQDIYLRAYVLDMNGTRKSISDELRIHVIDKN